MRGMRQHRNFRRWQGTNGIWVGNIIHYLCIVNTIFEDFSPHRTILHMRSSSKRKQYTGPYDKGLVCTMHLNTCTDIAPIHYDNNKQT